MSTWLLSGNKNIVFINHIHFGLVKTTQRGTTRPSITQFGPRMVNSEACMPMPPHPQGRMRYSQYLLCLNYPPSTFSYHSISPSLPTYILLHADALMRYPYFCIICNSLNWPWFIGFQPGPFACGLWLISFGGFRGSFSSNTTHK